MECLLCGQETNGVDSGGDYEERACASCGHYKITRTARTELDNLGFRLDLELTREWISQQQGAGLIPVIDSHTAMRLIAT